MLFGKKKSYQLKERSEKKNSTSVGKYTKKTEKKYNTVFKSIVDKFINWFVKQK